MSHVQKILDLYKEGKVEKSTIIKMAAFKDELQNFFNDMEKTAKLDEKTKGFILGSLAKPILATSSYLIGKGVNLLEQAGRDLKSEKDFENMLKARPELRNEDQLIIRKYWDSLVYFAPSIARDPLAAGAYIKQAMEYEDKGGPPYSAIRDLVQTHRTFQESQPFQSRRMGEVIALNPPTLIEDKKSKDKEEQNKKPKKPDFLAFGV